MLFSLSLMILIFNIFFCFKSGELLKHCALLVCQFQVILEEAPSEQFEICVLARNQIAAACECVIYLRYICFD